MKRRGCLVLVGAAVGLGAALAAWAQAGRPARYGRLASATERAEPSPDLRYRLTAVRIGAWEGGTVDCLLRRPTGGDGPFLTVVLAGGIGTGRRAATLVDGRHAALLISCDYPWDDPSDLPLPRLVWRLPAVRGGILGTPQALALAATYLLAQPGADPRRLAAVGASLGVPFVAAWAASDRRVAAVALGYGGGDLRTLFEAALRGRIGHAGVRRLVASAIAGLLTPLDPLRTVGRIAPRPVLLIGSREDERIPRTAVDALVTAARDPKTVIWFGGRHMLPRDSVLMREIGDSTVAWLERSLPPLSSPSSTGHLR